MRKRDFKTCEYKTQTVSVPYSPKRCCNGYRSVCYALELSTKWTYPKSMKHEAEADTMRDGQARNVYVQLLLLYCVYTLKTASRDAG